MKYFKITFDNGYCGCEYETFYATEDENVTIEEIEDLYQNEFDEYCYENEDVADGYDYSNYNWNSEEDKIWYYDNCVMDIEEILKEEYYKQSKI